MKLLKMKDVMRLRSISQEVLFEHTLAQLQRQHYYLSNLRIRNTSMVNAFGDIISSAVNKKSDINTWVVNSKHLLSKEFDKIAVEGSRWKGQGITMTNLILPMNEICHHSLYAILCLDLVTIDALDRGLTTSSVSLHEFIERVSENVMSFAKEKFGVSPEIFVKGDANVEIFPPLIEYVTVEIAKNSIKAVVDRYGALDIDDAPPIEVNINQHLDKNSESGIISIMFKDCGVGMNEHALRRCFDAFYSKTAETNSAQDPSYHYSREFGAPFSGAGIGLLKSKVYLDFHDATIDVKSEEGNGTTVSIYMP